MLSFSEGAGVRRGWVMSGGAEEVCAHEWGHLAFSGIGSRALGFHGPRVGADGPPG